MATHSVKLHLEHSISVGNNDFCFDVIEDDSKIGTLKVSRGTVDWFPKNSKKLHYSMDWSALGDLIMQNGREKDRPVRRRR